MYYSSSLYYLDSFLWLLPYHFTEVLSREEFFGSFLSSGQQDLNLRPHGPQPCALPSYAIPRSQQSELYQHSSKKSTVFFIFLFFFSLSGYCSGALFKQTFQDRRTSQRKHFRDDFSVDEIHRLRKLGSKVFLSTCPKRVSGEARWIP